MSNEQLLNFLNTIRAELISALQTSGRDSSGQTSAQISITEDENAVKLEVPGYVRLLETGRKPTSNNAPRSNPPMIERIQVWCQEKGLSEKAAWAIKKSIDKKGFKGTPGLLDALTEDNLNQKLVPFLDNMADDTRAEISNLLNVK